WDSWADDTVVGDRERGVWGERSRLHAPHFHGEVYDVEGIQPSPRSPQGHPVLVQAGQSAAGIDLAARYAELVFSGPPRSRPRLPSWLICTDRQPPHVVPLSRCWSSQR